MLAASLALLDPGSMYSYVSIYLASHYGVSPGSLPSRIYVLTPVGDALVVDQG